MEHFKNIERRDGVDIVYKKDLHPEDNKFRVGSSGFDKNLKLNDLLEIAYTMNNPRPNIIIKAGKNAKWYLKYCSFDKINEQIEKNKWRDSSRCIMYIVTW
jgi:hypothetical protein